MVVFSVLVGLTSLVPIYFQKLLVEQTIDGSGSTYTLAVTVVVMFLRFNLLNVSLPRCSMYLTYPAVLLLTSNFISKTHLCESSSI
jgi:hypothetical protein